MIISEAFHRANTMLALLTELLLLRADQLLQAERGYPT